MNKVNPERVEFIEMVLLQKAWVRYKKPEKATIKMLTQDEVTDIIHDIQVGKTFVHTIDGMYIVDGGASYGFYEYNFKG